MTEPEPPPPPITPSTPPAEHHGYDAAAARAQAAHAAHLGMTFAQFARRAFDWNLADLEPSALERTRLQALGITSAAAVRYHAWRRSALTLIAPLFAITAVFAIIDLTDVETEGLTGLGSMAAYLPSIVLIVLPVMTGLALLKWTDLRVSQRIVFWSWLVSVIVPIVIALLPPEWLLDTAGLDREEKAAALLTAGLILSIGYGVSLVPTLVSIPSGVMRGCLRVKALLPQSVLPGWFLVSVAPFYSLMACVAFVMIMQVAGSPLLIVGVAIIAFGPLLYVRNASLYIRAVESDDERRRLARLQRVSLIMTLVAYAFIALWAFTKEIASGDDGSVVRLFGFSGSSLFKPWDFILRAFELVARSLLTSVVFAHIFLQMNRTSWVYGRQFSGTRSEAEYDRTMAELDPLLAPVASQPR
jgi:hypothetical protein